MSLSHQGGERLRPRREKTTREFASRKGEDDSHLYILQKVFLVFKMASSFLVTTQEGIVDPAAIDNFFVQKLILEEFKFSPV